MRLRPLKKVHLSVAKRGSKKYLENMMPKNLLFVHEHSLCAQFTLNSRHKRDLPIFHKDKLEILFIKWQTFSVSTIDIIDRTIRPVEKSKKQDLLFLVTSQPQPSKSTTSQTPKPAASTNAQYAIIPFASTSKVMVFQSLHQY